MESRVENNINHTPKISINTETKVKKFIESSVSIKKNKYINEIIVSKPENILKPRVESLEESLNVNDEEEDTLILLPSVEELREVVEKYLYLT